MKTSKAGTALPNISQIGNALSIPIGLINQPLTEGLVTLRPFGTFSFYRWVKVNINNIRTDMITLMQLHLLK